MMNKLKLGDRITISKRLRRVTRFIEGVNCAKKYISTHEKRSWEILDIYPPIDVMIIRKRTLRNGTITYHSDIGKVFECTGTIQAYLVVKDMNTKPFYIEMSNF